jgi:hypothetical protein
MFCPECKCEYREGFTHCSTCDVDLVESLDAADGADDVAGNPAGAKPKKLWNGVDRSVLDSICDALEAANIPYSNETLEPRLLYASMRDDSLEVWVRESDYEAAREVLRRQFGGSESGDADAALPGIDSTAQGTAVPGVMGQTSAGFGVAIAEGLADLDREGEDHAEVDPEPDPSAELPAQDSVAGVAPDDVPDEAADDLDPDGPTVEVWSGPQIGMADILKNCLAENGITALVVAAGNERERLLVHAHNEERAREVVHEVVEAAPPELE